ncbi:MAG: class I SAM-dependent methyltransferase [Gammaproteobacteria bacterium]|jgi:2-polyprenyl-3-methyl-5-hydroxy-6-metoxy-1,4-benzoquinol methylase|nr:class I SAM-dependent methyltransferase [Gammaproteobacteria bacterium]MBT7603300.1 class I SAM-dependent methyltransferase [Gammaproteobacteria bacterium]
MAYSNLTNFNKNFIKKFTHNTRFNVAQKILRNHTGDNISNVLDYGTGDGEFLKLLNKNFIDLKDISAYEPLVERYDEVSSNTFNYNNIFVYKDIKEIEKKFDAIFCMEVFEHLNEKMSLEALSNISSLMKSNSILIVSVPIETGLGGFLKNLVRIVIRQTHSGTNLKNLFKIFFGFKINRNTNVDFISSHIGFSHNDLLKLIKKVGFNIIKKTYSPFPFFGSLLNSQIFLVLKK